MTLYLSLLQLLWDMKPTSNLRRLFTSRLRFKPPVPEKCSTILQLPSPDTSEFNSIEADSITHNSWFYRSLNGNDMWDEGRLSCEKIRNNGKQFNNGDHFTLLNDMSQKPSSNSSYSESPSFPSNTSQSNFNFESAPDPHRQCPSAFPYNRLNSCSTPFFNKSILTRPTKINPVLLLTTLPPMSSSPHFDPSSLLAPAFICPNKRRRKTRNFSTESKAEQPPQPDKEDKSVPTSHQLRLVLLTSCIPFIGFGFVDNFFMIVLGDYVSSLQVLSLSLFSSIPPSVCVWASRLSPQLHGAI